MTGSDPRRPLARLCLAAGLTATLLTGLASDGVYHEDDLSHFLMARWATRDGRFLLDEWARPGFTLWHALPAAVGAPETGWHLCRAVSALLHAWAAWLAYLVAWRWGLHRAWMAIPLFYLQPTPTQLALTTLTETPLSLYLAAATLLLLHRRPVLSALLISLAPLTRQDAIVFLLLWGVVLWRSKGPLSAYLSLLFGLAAHNLLGAVYLERLPLISYLEPSGASHYGRGTPFTMLVRLALCSGPAVLALAMAGIPWLHRRALGWLPLAGVALYVAVHTVLYALGLFSTGGYARFLVPLGPWLAVLAVAGWELCQARTARLSRKAWAVVAATLAGLWLVGECEWALRPVLLTPAWQPWVGPIRIALGLWGLTMLLAASVLFRWPCGRPGRAGLLLVVGSLVLLAGAGILYGLRPLRMQEEHRIVREAVAAVIAAQPCEQSWVAMNPWVYYWSDRWYAQGEPPTRQIMDLNTPGRLIFWDGRFCREREPPVILEDLRARPGLVELFASRALHGAPWPYMVVFAVWPACPPEGAGSDSGLAMPSPAG